MARRPILSQLFRQSAGYVCLTLISAVPLDALNEVVPEFVLSGSQNCIIFDQVPALF